MTIAIHCSDIAWERRTENLPGTCDLKLELDSVPEFTRELARFRLPDAAAVDAYLDGSLREIL